MGGAFIEITTHVWHEHLQATVCFSLTSSYLISVRRRQCVACCLGTAREYWGSTSKTQNNSCLDEQRQQQLLCDPLSENLEIYELALSTAYSWSVTFIWCQPFWLGQGWDRKLVGQTNQRLYFL